MSQGTVQSVVSAYLLHCERQNRAGAFSTDHLANVRRDLTRFATHIGEKLVTNCKQHDLSSWLEANEQWKSACTRQNAVAAVIGCFKWAEEEQLIDQCPYRRPRSLRGTIMKPRRPGTPAEYKALLRSGSRPLKQAMFFLWETGARTCEMRELLWTDIVFGHEPRIILVEHKTARKTGRTRVIALNPVIEKFLLWLKRRSTSKFVFVNNDGTPWERRAFAKHLRRVAQRIGLDKALAGDVGRVSAYCFRHTYCCALLAAGMTSKQVADQMGHVDTTMVERVYGSFTTKDMTYMSQNAAEARRLRR